MKIVNGVRHAESWEEFLRASAEEGGSHSTFSRTNLTGRYVHPSYFSGPPEEKAYVRLIVTPESGTLHSPPRDWNKEEDHLRDLWEAASVGGILFNSSSPEEIAAAKKVWEAYGGPDWQPS